MDKLFSMHDNDLALLQWYQEIGVDEVVELTPTDKITSPVEKVTVPNKPKTETTMTKPKQRSPALSNAVESARKLAHQANTLEELKEALNKFDGCALKHTATNLVFGEGNPDADIMFIGEAPGADEDRLGRPFVGISGKLLDKILATIGLDRTKFYITNIIPWRPPGNRQPTTAETAACLAFVERHIELVSPKVIVMVGGTAAGTLLDNTDGITRLRGKWLSYKTPNMANPIEAYAIYHPAYLLRSPRQKRNMWKDILTLKLHLTELGIL